MDKQTSKFTLLFAAGFSLLAAAVTLPFAQAEGVHVLVKSEVSGTDRVYRYELINHSTNLRMEEFAIGIKLVDPADRKVAGTPMFGSLTRLPTNTLWGMGPTQSEEFPEFPRFPNRRTGWLIPIPDPGSVTSPPGWRVEISGVLRTPGSVDTPAEIALERYAITWYPPKPVYGGSLNVTGADAGQRLAGFSVRVPQDSTVGPGSLGTLAGYDQGDFNTELWYGSSFFNFFDSENKVRIFSQITASPSLEVFFTTGPGSPTPVLPSSLVTVTAKIWPLVLGETAPAIRLESSLCWGDCAPTEGVTGAAFGTDDRTFQLQAAYHPPSDSSNQKRYRLYDITYSVTDAAGNYNTIMSKIIVVSRSTGNS